VEVKRPERDVDRSSPYSAEVKNKWSRTSFSPIYIPSCREEGLEFITVILGVGFMRC
jgi:hypothetical protein